MTDTNNHKEPKPQKHTISVLVENRSGVLARIAGLFSARGFNIDSLAVGETEDPSVSRMTIVVKGDEKVLEQVEKQLNKLVDVIKVSDFMNVPHIQRDLALIKVKADKNTRSELLQIVDIFRAKIVDVSHDTIIVEMTGDEEKISALLEMIAPFGIREICRTGVIAIGRGNKIVSIAKEKEKEKLHS
jgi:acetolactate synthase-1/3 small subunit